MRDLKSFQKGSWQNWTGSGCLLLHGAVYFLTLPCVVVVEWYVVAEWFYVLCGWW